MQCSGDAGATGIVARIRIASSLRIRPRNESRSDHGDACVHVVGSSESTSDIPYPLGAAVPRVMSDTSGE